MAEICQVTVPVTTTGTAGSASGSGATPVMHGFLLDVYLDYHASAPATTDVTIAHTAPTFGNIVVVTDNATDGRYAPRAATVDGAGAAITGVYDHYPLNGILTVTVAGSDALAPAVTARIRYLR